MVPVRMSINSDFPSQLLMEEYEQMGKIMRFSLLCLLVNCSKDKNNNAKRNRKIVIMQPANIFQFKVCLDKLQSHLYGRLVVLTKHWNHIS
jgi:hypothetical protein